MKTGRNKKSPKKKRAIRRVSYKISKRRRNKKSPKKKRAIRRVSYKIRKRRRKDVYDIHLGRGRKSKDEIENAIENVKLKMDMPSDSAKITFIAQYRNKKSTISYIYDQLDNPDQLRESMQEIRSAIFQKKIPRTKKDSLKRMSRLKQYISRIIIDFETE